MNGTKEVRQNQTAHNPMAALTNAFRPGGLSRLVSNSTLKEYISDKILNSLEGLQSCFGVPNC